MRGALLVAPVVGIALAAGCVRDEEDPVCPEVSAGALVITEIAGEQTGNDLPPWIELYNASSGSVDLRGARVRFRKVDGSGESFAIVRRQLFVDPGSYLTLGLIADGDRPDYIDYGFAGDFTGSWLSSAAVQLEACGQLIDDARYSSLPRTGSYALGGVTTPSAQTNDNPQAWCTDPQITPGTAIPGTPGAANPPCGAQ